MFRKRVKLDIIVDSGYQIYRNGNPEGLSGIQVIEKPLSMACNGRPYCTFTEAPAQNLPETRERVMAHGEVTTVRG
jgi:hypothetical protein